MVSEILRSVQGSEKEADSIIENAKQKAVDIGVQAKEDIAAKKEAYAAELAQETKRRMQAVREEEERKDQEFAAKVGEELEVIAREASGKEDGIIAELAKKVYAL